MVQENSIICPHCRKPSGYAHTEIAESTMQEDLKCKNCNSVVIRSQSVLSSGPTKRISWDEKTKRREYWWKVNP